MADDPPPRRPSRSSRGVKSSYDENASDDEFEANIRGYDPKAAAESDIEASSANHSNSSDSDHDERDNDRGNNDENDPENIDIAGVNIVDISDDDEAAAAANEAAAADEDDDGAPTQQSFPPERREYHLRLYNQVLEHYGLMYIRQCTVGQLSTMAVTFIRSDEARGFRKPDVQSLIDAHHNEHGDESFHDQELNELCCILDYIIKQKCCIHSIIRCLEAGDLRIRVIVGEGNPDFNGQPIPDVYVFIPARLVYEICQGAAFRWFDDYRGFGGHVKEFQAARYLVGLYSARILDLDAKDARTTGTLLAVHEEDEEQLHYGENGVLHSVCRPLEPTYVNKSHYVVTLSVPGAPGEAHKIRLHRLGLILANQLGLTVFTQGNLEAIGLTLPQDSTYDMHLNAYRPLTNTNERKTILSQLRTGDEYSRQCDGDHCLSSDEAYYYIHGLSCMSAVSHRCNMCNIYVRRNAGHWCKGFALAEYIDGNTFSLVNTTFIDRITFRGGEARFDGAPIEETDVFTLLPRLENWIVDVDDDNE
eukprot:scaffold6555_cov171-Skeletonema_menzelii.AAC.1